MSVITLAIRFARRELRSRLSGFRIFFACLVLGVAAIAGVGSLAQALLQGMSSQGRVLLGGDVAVDLVHRPTTPQERAFLDARGQVSATVSMRAMGYAITGSAAFQAAPVPAGCRRSQCAEGERQLIELKAVDRAYPLYGSVGLLPAGNLGNALACEGSVCGAVAEQTLLDRLHLSRGGILRIGSADFRVAAVLASEPDRISGGFSLGPHVIISDEGLSRTGLVTLGSLIEYSYRVRLFPAISIAAFKGDAEHAFPDAGWQIRDRDNAAPGTRRFVEQVAMFLTLVGLTVLAVAGVGAGQAVHAFLDRKREEIATLKALGADGT